MKVLDRVYPRASEAHLQELLRQYREQAGRTIADAERRGFRQMIAVIGDAAQVPSIALHRAAGFRLIGTLEAVGFKHGRWLDTVVMQRPLGPGATTNP